MGKVTDILEKIYGKKLVKEDRFKIEEEKEDIFYIDSIPSCNKNEQIWFSKLDDLNYLKQKTENGNKCFLFFTIDNSKYPDKEINFDEYIFSIEIVESQPEGFFNVATINDLVTELNCNDTIIRIHKRNTQKIDIVAIKIGKEENRDFSALKNYIVSSDNRTYNKVVRNMVEYIEVSGKTVPENKTELAHNLLLSGAPGTGKSHFLSKKVLEAGESIINEAEKCDSSQKTTEAKRGISEKDYCSKFVTRVTFYEDYSYENFIGCYKPIPKDISSTIKFDSKDGTISENKITYSYVSGPFIDTYIKAKKDYEHNYFLIIEEINRAKAASVFGEMFQLLDRNKDGSSDYDIKPDAALNDYLTKELGDEYDGFMKLPKNMYLWATMNSADQGVLPLDSAFKRRWTSMYMEINGSICEYRMKIQKNETEFGIILWDDLRTKINEIILKNGFDEDRCIGPWYFSESEIETINNYYKSDDSEPNEDKLSSKEERMKKVNPLIDKLFFYLRQDLFRRNPKAIFRNEIGDKEGITMSDLRRRVRQGESIETILNFGENAKLKWLEEENVSITTTNQDSDSVSNAIATSERV